MKAADALDGRDARSTREGLAQKHLFIIDTLTPHSALRSLFLVFYLSFGKPHTYKY